MSDVIYIFNLIYFFKKIVNLGYEEIIEVVLVANKHIYLNISEHI